MEDEVKGKRPFQDLVDNPSSSSATGTKSEVQGAKRPCVEETRIPNYKVMDDTEDEPEKIDIGKNDMRNGGYYLCFEGNKIHVVGKRPPAVTRRWGPGPPPPKALTYKRMARRMAETGLSYIRGDDPVFAINWNPFPVATYSSPTPAATADSSG